MEFHQHLPRHFPSTKFVAHFAMFAKHLAVSLMYQESMKSRSAARDVKVRSFIHLIQCFSTAGPWPDTEPWHQLYRAARRSPGSCHFSFLSVFHE